MFREALLGDTMKNKKLITITVCLVSAVLIGMFGLSKFFENSWQQEKTVDNDLNAEIIDNGEMKIDYPYTVSERSLNSDDYPNIISYQEAANIAGEAILYLSGVTEHQKVAGEINLDVFGYGIANEGTDLSNGIIYKQSYPRYWYSSEIEIDMSDELCPKYIRLNCAINAETGEIVGIGLEDYSEHGQDYIKIDTEYMPNTWKVNQLSQNEIDNTLDYINQITDVLGWECKPVSYSMEERGTPYGMAYMADIMFDNGNGYLFVICNEDGNLKKGGLIEMAWNEYDSEELAEFMPIG